MEVVVEGSALLRGNAAGIGSDAVAKEEDDERSKFAAYEQDEAEGEKLEEIVLGAVVEDVLPSRDVWNGDHFLLFVEMGGATVAGGGTDGEWTDPAFHLVELGPVAFDVFHTCFVEFEVGAAEAEVVGESLFILLAYYLVERSWAS